MTKPKLFHWTPRDEGDLPVNCSDFARRSRDSIHTARHDTDSTVLSCLVGGVNWAYCLPSDDNFDNEMRFSLQTVTVGNRSSSTCSSRMMTFAG